MAAVVVDGFAGETFETLVFVTLGLSDNDVFGLLNGAERTVDGADLTRDAVDDRVDVVVLDVVTFVDEIVLDAGFVAVLKYLMFASVFVLSGDEEKK